MHLRVCVCVCVWGELSDHAAGAQVEVVDSVKDFIKACTEGYGARVPCIRGCGLTGRPRAGKVKLVLDRGRYYVESNDPRALFKLNDNEHIRGARVRPDVRARGARGVSGVGCDSGCSAGGPHDRARGAGHGERARGATRCWRCVRGAVRGVAGAL